ncbi:uncharacterized protein LOC117192872 [Drosophila miranda]|uniref:uncharacterized protein LOC117192872 n=1 Tax=Drosophila miranda TaxID=7229 RepID=UPI00143F6382|nr:uncharacterized protein LOC117192872 [Drosophila miranda]
MQVVKETLYSSNHSPNNILAIQAICLVCSVILLGSVTKTVSAEGLDIDKMAKCFDLCVEVASVVGQKIVPTIKSLAKCAKFKPMKTKDLDPTAVLMLAYQFIQKIVGNQICLLNTIQETRDLLAPFAQRSLH